MEPQLSSSSKRKVGDFPVSVSRKGQNTKPSANQNHLQLVRYASECMAAAGHHYATGVFVDRFNIFYDIMIVLSWRAPPPSTLRSNRRRWLGYYMHFVHALRSKLASIPSSSLHLNRAHPISMNCLKRQLRYNPKTIKSFLYRRMV